MRVRRKSIRINKFARRQFEVNVWARDICGAAPCLSSGLKLYTKQIYMPIYLNNECGNFTAYIQ